MRWKRKFGERRGGGGMAAGSIAALMLSLVVAAAPAAASSFDEDTWFVTFAGTNDVTSIGPDGETSSESYERDVTLRCTPESCFYFEYYSETDVPLSASKPSGSTSWPGTGEYCSDEAWSGPGEGTVSFSGTTLTVEARIEGSGWQDCNSDGGRSATYGQINLLVADYVDGELCVLTGDECPVTDGAAPIETAEGDGVPADSTSTSRSALNTGSASAPSVLSGLATPASAGTAPGQLALAALLTVILVLLVAFPTSLLNSAMEAGSDRWEAWWAARRGRRASPVPVTSDGAAEPEPAVEATPASTTRPWWWAGAGVAVAGLISAFVDPEFGFNPGSARVLLSILVSFGIDVVLGWFLVIWLVRKVAPGATHSFVFRPVTLLIVVAAVVFTRLTGFEPGIVFGLVAGVAFGALVGRASEAKAALATLGYAFGVALIAWAAYGALGGTAGVGESFWSTFGLETLASIAVGGMAALPVALFPIRGMAGFAVWSWNRWVWAGCYALGLFAFFIVLMPMPFSWAGVGWDLTAWIGVYLVYAIGAAAIWAAITRPWVKPEPEASAADDPPVAEEVVGN